MLEFFREHGVVIFDAAIVTALFTLIGVIFNARKDYRVAIAAHDAQARKQYTDDLHNDLQKIKLELSQAQTEIEKCRGERSNERLEIEKLNIMILHLESEIEDLIIVCAQNNIVFRRRTDRIIPPNPPEPPLI